LKAALCAGQAEIDAALPKLTSAEIAEHQGLMATEIQSADAETENLRAEVAEEAKLAQNMRAMQIPRRAVAALGREVERRAERGVFASAELLVGEAIERTFRPEPRWRGLCQANGHQL
jgi:hypothetical protein